MLKSTALRGPAGRRGIRTGRGKGNAEQPCPREKATGRGKQSGKPFFFGPLQMTASSGLLSKKPTDITPRLSSRNCGG